MVGDRVELDQVLFDNLKEVSRYLGSMRGMDDIFHHSRLLSRFTIRQST